MGFSVNVDVNPDVLQLLEKLPGQIVEKSLPLAFNRAEPFVAEAIRQKLPDSRNNFGPDGRSNKSKQSKIVKRKFQTHITEEIGSRVKKRDLSLVKVIGVTNEALQVNFDYGEKAMTKGRTHKLWWVDSIHEKYHNPPQRKQSQDVPVQVANEVADRVNALVKGALEEVLGGIR